MNLSKDQVQVILEMAIASGMFMAFKDGPSPYLTAMNTTISSNAIADAAKKKAEELMTELDEVLKCKKEEK